ncbi:lipoate--protein ligase family protein [Thiohalorhabdus sp. Cl-TMA]|uniref:Biotin/lipoate A/B protein ligase family protein n=1 Tax=Thiohalorhabdus methylotrophus TaxID=3242694 RepID=A0ABV4TRX3_9GAMM
MRSSSPATPGRAATVPPEPGSGARRARWLEAGPLAPFDLHAFYHGLGYAMGPEDAPILAWARADRPHISLGPHQDAAEELSLDASGRAGGMEVVRRETGGGTVYVDGDQWVYAFLVPRTWLRGRPVDLYGHLLPAVEATFARFGLSVSRRSRNDLWCGNRKIGGTGMATLGNALVLVGSFMLRFPAARFAAAVNSPSPAYRRFLAAALAEAVRGWDAFGKPPRAAPLKGAFRQAAARSLGWVVSPDRCSTEEVGAIREARHELRDPEWRWEPLGHRAVREGIKLKGDAFLTERAIPTLGRITVQTEGGRIRRLDLAGIDPARTAACTGLPLHAGLLAARLGGGEVGRRWAEAVVATAVQDDHAGATGHVADPADTRG